MPRPPTKRNRPTSKALPASKGNPQINPRRDEVNPGNVSGSQEDNQQNRGDSQLAPNPQLPETSRHVKDQTPMAKVQDQAIESSPMGERGATGSRPPTRSRGYSSTLSIAGRKGDGGSKVPGTPAFESSILSNFRRRPRQPSILQMMQAEDGSSDLDDDDFLGGLSPEDESTPLNISRGKSLLIRNGASSSPSQPSLPSSNASRKRKRSVEELQVPQSPLAIVGNTPTPTGSPTPEDRRYERRDPATLPQPSESLDLLSQTMAPPMSSSPPSSPAKLALPYVPDQQLNVAREHTKTTAKQATTNKNCLPTATLQDKLLPRRRQRRRKIRHASGLEASSDLSENDSVAEQDDDELSYLPSRKTSKQQRKQKVKPKPSTKPQTKQGNQKAVEAVDSRTHSSAHRWQYKDMSHSCRSSEYPEVEKENQPTDTSSPLSSPPDSDALESDCPPESTGADFLSEELRSQAKKFAEVDKWKMDFEDVGSSQNSTVE